MANVLDIAKWFVKYNLDTPRNSLEGNMKLQKLIYFSQLVHLAKYNEVLFDEPILAYENGCVIEEVRVAYKNDHYSFVSQSNTLKEDFNDNQLETLKITAEIFGKITPEELSELNHLHSSWIEAYERSKGIGGFRFREHGVISIDVIRENDLQKINKMLDAFEVSYNYKQEYIIVNGVTFYYDPREIKLTNQVISELEEYSRENNSDTSYSVYLDEKIGLVVF